MQGEAASNSLWAKSIEKQKPEQEQGSDLLCAKEKLHQCYLHVHIFV